LFAGDDLYVYDQHFHTIFRTAVDQGRAVGLVDLGDIDKPTSFDFDACEQ
jgi:hypothetical protein